MRNHILTLAAGGGGAAAVDPTSLLCFQELVGTLRGFDDYVNMVMEDVTEFEVDSDGNRTKVHLDQILLNGNNVAMLVPGGSPPS